MAKAIDWTELLHPDYLDIKTMLIELYTNKNLSLQSVGNIIGIHSDPLRKKLLALGIKLHAKGRPSPTNIRVERKQGKNKPKDSAAESALKREATKLGMRPDDYLPVETRKTEKRNCPRFDDCLTYSAILHGWVIPCRNCTGKPVFLESLERTLPMFDHQLGKTMPIIILRSPGVEKEQEQEQEPNQFHKYLEGIYKEGY